MTQPADFTILIEPTVSNDQQSTCPLSVLPVNNAILLEFEAGRIRQKQYSMVQFSLAIGFPQGPLGPTCADGDWISVDGIRFYFRQTPGPGELPIPSVDNEYLDVMRQLAFTMRRNPVLASRYTIDFDFPNGPILGGCNFTFISLLPGDNHAQVTYSFLVIPLPDGILLNEQVAAPSSDADTFDQLMAWVELWVDLTTQEGGAGTVPLGQPIPNNGRLLLAQTLTSPFVNDTCRFELSYELARYVATQVPPQTDGFVWHPKAMIRYALRWGAQWNTPAGSTAYRQIGERGFDGTSSYIIWNGGVDTRLYSNELDVAYSRPHWRFRNFAGTIAQAPLSKFAYTAITGSFAYSREGSGLITLTSLILKRIGEDGLYQPSTYIYARIVAYAKDGTSQTFNMTTQRGLLFDTATPDQAVFGGASALGYGMFTWVVQLDESNGLSHADVTIMATNGNGLEYPLTQTVRYLQPCSPCGPELGSIMWLNRLGGWDTWRVRGSYIKSRSYEQQQGEREYDWDAPIQSRKTQVVYVSDQAVQWALDLGRVDAAHAEYLSDLASSPEVYYALPGDQTVTAGSDPYDISRPRIQYVAVKLVNLSVDYNTYDDSFPATCTIEMAHTPAGIQI